MKRISWTVGVLTLLATGGYLFVYIYRWEWHRALLVGVLFLACMLALATALVLRRLAALERHMAAAGTTTGGDADRVLQRLREAPRETAPFPWLTSASLDRTNIFIPILLGGGVLVSGIAWLVERVAGQSARSGVEAEVASELHGIGFPRTALVPVDAELLACDEDFTDDPRLRLLLGPVGHSERP